jgi:hypothetical protein
MDEIEYKDNKSKSIRLVYDQNQHNKFMQNKSFFKTFLDSQVIKYPELFPKEISNGYILSGQTRQSKKLDELQFQKIQIKSTGDIFIIYPTFVMPYLIDYTTNVQDALYFRKFNVPYSALTYVYGHSDMFWYRAETSFGKNSIVGTTIKDKNKLPNNIVSDEKQTKIKKAKCFIAMTVADDCILGASACKNAGEEELTNGYGEFAKEARNLEEGYSPKTVNIDGWNSTAAAFKTLFPLTVCILCFLHGFIKIRDCCKKSDLFHTISHNVWHVYFAETKRKYSQRSRRLKEWAKQNLSGTVLTKVVKLCDRSDKYQAWYDHPKAYRTSNMVDRMMKWFDQNLFAQQYFHGTIVSANQRVRAWAIFRNYYPLCPRAIRSDENGLVCAASRLNGYHYSDNWLENLLAATSLGGFRQ